MTAYDATTGGATAAEPPQDSRSLGEIVGDISTNFTTLVRQEIDLAKTELKQEATTAGKGIGMLAGAAITGLLVMLFLSWALLWLLDNWMPVELAALIVAVLWAIVTAVLASTGRKMLQQANPQLPQTQQTLKEDASWARAQKS
jgi:uncharacterized membrane protein YqjE